MTVPSTLHYGISPCWLGYVFVAFSTKGIAGVLLGDVAQHMLDTAQERYKGVQLEQLPPSHPHAAQLKAVQSTIEAPPPIPDLPPLDITGTPFQRKVWDALCTIPAGQTKTYSQIAATIGQPTATRAVARACADNMHAILIPCHRVVGKNQKLTGYRWGVERKRALLEREGVLF